MSAIIILCIISILLILIPNIIWNKKYGKNYIDAEKLPLRKKYRLLSSFGMMLFMVTILNLMETIGFLEDNMAWVVLPLMFMSQNRLLFEPYYTSEVVDKLENFCLYLRPFDLSAKNKGYWAKGELNIPESIEKLFCAELNKRIAKTYCVGDPNNAMPTTLSTSGIYASDTEWKSVVSMMAKNSKIILLRVMKTEGCKWELRHCIDQYLYKTIFLIDSVEHWNLLKVFLEKRSEELPDVVFSNNNCIALFLDNERRSWNVVKVRSIADIKSIVNDYILSHKQVKEKVEGKSKIIETIKQPFLLGKSEIKFYHYISFCLQPLWYIAFNKWPKWWIAIGVLYALVSLVISIVLSIVWNEIYLSVVMWLIILLPWIWLAPRISEAFDIWGSKFLCREGNKVLCKWVLVYALLSFSFSLNADNQIEESNSMQNNEELFENYLRYIMEDENHYIEYKPLFMQIDSAYNNVYTDEEVRESMFECLKSLEINGDDSLSDSTEYWLDRFCKSVSKINNNKFEGWAITHKFSYCDDIGNYKENMCLVLIDEKLEYFYVYSLDENERHLNYYELKNMIDELYSKVCGGL